MSLHFEATLDNSDLKKKIEETKSALNTVTKELEQSGTSMDDLFGKMKQFGTIAGAMFAVGGLTDFVRQVATVRGEFQQLEIAFSTMLGNRAEADELMRQVAETAAKTPFDLQGVADGAKQLLAYGTASDNVVSTLTMLGDIASGVSAPLNDIVYLYGTTMTQGRMFTQDLRQFQGRGIPLAEELAKQFGVAKEEVGDLVTAGKVGAEEFRKAIESMAKGKFNNLMEEQSKSITGQISNLEDQVSQMFNEIGKSSEGVISTALDGAGLLLEHYKSIGEAIAVLVATYGTYRAIMIASVAVQNACRVASLSEVAALGAKTVAINVANAAQQRFNLTVLKNPYVIAAVAIAGLGYAIYKAATAMDAGEQATANFNDTLSKQNEAIEEAQQKGETLMRTIQDTNETNYAREKAYNQLLALYPSLIGNLELETAKTLEARDAILLLNQARDAKAVSMKQEEIDKRNLALSAYTSTKNGYKISEYATAEQKKAIEELDQRGMFGRLGDNNNRDFIKQLRAEKEMFERELKRTEREQKYAGWNDKEKGDYHKRLASVYGNELTKAKAEQEEARKRGDMKKAEELQRKIESHQRVIQDNEAKSASFSAKANEQKRRTLSVVTDEIKKQTEAYEGMTRAEQQSEAGQKLLKDIQRLKAEKKSLELPDAPKSSTKGGSADKALKERKELQEAQLRFEKEFQRQMTDLAFVAEETRINGIAETSKREEQLRQLNNKKRLESIKREQEDMLSDKGADRAKVELLTKIKKENLALDESAEERQRLENDAKAMRQYLIEYGTYEEKRKALREEADRSIRESTTEGERLSIEAKLRLDLSELDRSYGKLQTTISKLFSDLSEKGAKELKALAKEAEAFQSYLANGKWQEVGTSGLDQHGLSRKQFEEQSLNPEKLAEVARRTEEIKNKALEAGGAFGQVAEGVKALFEAGDNPQKLEKALASINAGLGKVTGGLGFLKDAFASLGESLDSKALTNISEGIGVATDAISKAQQGMQAGAMFGPIGAAIGGVVGGVTSLISSFAKMKDARHEKTIQRLQSQVEALDRSYKKLGREIDNAFSSDASRLIAEQDTLLRQKQVLLRQQMSEEKAKKKTDGAKVNAYKEQIEAINDTLADNARKAKDAIFGSDVKSAINDFASAYADAWANGNDRAETAKEFVKKQIRAMVLEAIKMKTSKPMEAIREQLAEYFKDGVMSVAEAETVNRMATNLSSQLDAMMSSEAKNWLEGSSSESISGSSRGFQAMSQETGSELNGRFTAIQQDMLSVVGLTTEIRTLHLLELGHLEAISRNTLQLHEMNERLGTIERNTRGLR